jgi:DNA modification methylase
VNEVLQVAAKRLGRNYWGCDLSKRYVNGARKWLEETEAISLEGVV